MKVFKESTFYWTMTDECVCVCVCVCTATTAIVSRWAGQAGQPHPCSFYRHWSVWDKECLSQPSVQLHPSPVSVPSHLKMQDGWLSTQTPLVCPSTSQNRVGPLFLSMVFFIIVKAWIRQSLHRKIIFDFFLSNIHPWHNINRTWTYSYSHWEKK